MARTILTREEWLNKMAGHLQLLFAANGMTFDRPYKISCGLPSKGAFNKCGRVVGECWASGASAAGENEIFISPTQAESQEVASVLTHELIHAWDDCKNGHRKPFFQAAKSMGLIGKLTETKAGPELIKYIDQGIKSLRIGEYPHAEMDYTPKKKQSTRLLKVSCTSEDCGYFQDEGKQYTVRMSATTLSYAAPSCGCCDSVMVAEE